MGPRTFRGDKGPKAAGGGPIHARLTLGNPAVPALDMPRSERTPARFASLAASDAHSCLLPGRP